MANHAAAKVAPAPNDIITIDLSNDPHPPALEPIPAEPMAVIVKPRSAGADKVGELRSMPDADAGDIRLAGRTPTPDPGEDPGNMGAFKAVGTPSPQGVVPPPSWPKMTQDSSSGDDDDDDNGNKPAERRRSKYLLNPRSTFMRYWDVLLACLLMYTAVVTPFEVAFVEVKINGLFFLNRLVDVCFVTDMIFQFLLPVQGESGEWIADGKIIARKYMRSWFFVDLVSVLPYDVVGLVTDSKEASNLKALRVLRLMRLVKLLRILRAGRMFQRWEATMTINYGNLELIKFIVVLLAVSHWLGCAWHMVATLQAVDCRSTPEILDCVEPATWVYEYGYLAPMWEEGGTPSMWSLYCASVYWAVATVSTVGYGDVIPATDTERGFVIIAALLGAGLYAYMVGSITSIIQGMSIDTALFYQLMDALNGFMNEKNLPFDLRVRLRDFFRFRRLQRGPAEFKEIFDKMSPTLRSEVSQHINSKWVDNVQFFKGCSTEFVVELALSLTQSTYGARELVFKDMSRATHMYIVDKGMVVVSDDGRIVSAGGTFGEDMIFGGTTSAYVRQYKATTVTNTVLLRLAKENLLATMKDFPIEKRIMHKTIMHMVFRRTILEYTRGVRKLQRLAKEQHERSQKLLGFPVEDRFFEAAEAEGKASAKHDPNLIPVLYYRKEIIADGHEETAAELKEKTTAVMLIQRVLRARRSRHAAVGRATWEREVGKGQERLRALLRKLALEQEIFVRTHPFGNLPIMEEQEVTFDGLGRLDTANLQAMGIKWGTGDRILAAYRIETM